MVFRKLGSSRTQSRSSRHICFRSTRPEPVLNTNFSRYLSFRIYLGRFLANFCVRTFAHSICEPEFKRVHRILGRIFGRPRAWWASIVLDLLFFFVKQLVPLENTWSTHDVIPVSSLNNFTGFTEFKAKLHRVTLFDFMAELEKDSLKNRPKFQKGSKATGDQCLLLDYDIPLPAVRARKGPSLQFGRGSYSVPLLSGQTLYIHNKVGFNETIFFLGLHNLLRYIKFF